MPLKKPRFIKDYPIRIYKCGLKSGDALKLKKDMALNNSNGLPTGEIIRRNQIWQVLRGTQGTVWLLQPNGETHTWDDNESIFETFELAGSRKTRSIDKTKTKQKPWRRKPVKRQGKRGQAE